MKLDREPRGFRTNHAFRSQTRSNPMFFFEFVPKLVCVKCLQSRKRPCKRCARHDLPQHPFPCTEAIVQIETKLDFLYQESRKPRTLTQGVAEGEEEKVQVMIGNACTWELVL